jgi:hypothetical protein
MPTPYVKKIASDTGMALASVEAKWEQAKEAASKQYPGLETKDSGKFYSIVTSILKKMTHQKDETVEIKPISEILADIKAGKMTTAEATDVLANALVSENLKPYADSVFKNWGKRGYERLGPALLPGGKPEDIKNTKGLKESEEILESTEEAGRAAGKSLAKQAHPTVVKVTHGDGSSDDVKIKVLHNSASDMEKAAYHATAADHFKKEAGQAALLKHKAHKNELHKLLRKHSDHGLIDSGYSYAYSPVPNDAHPDVKAGIHACKCVHGLTKDVVESTEESLEETAKPYANPAFARTHKRVYNKLVGLYVPDFKEKTEAATRPALMPEALISSMKESSENMGHSYIFEDMGLEPRDIIIVTTTDSFKAIRVGDMVEMAKGADVEAICKILEKQVKEPCTVFATGVDASLNKLMALMPSK